MSSRKTIPLIVGVGIVSLIALFLLLVITNVFPSPIEAVPLDAGWLGIFFIFANGFFLSYNIVQTKVGIIERLLLSIGLGFGLTFAVTILIGILWEFSFYTLFLIQLVFLGTLCAGAVLRGFRINFGNFSLSRGICIRINQLNVLALLLIVVIGALLVIGLYKALALPATEWDSLAYGVQYAKIIFQEGKIPLIAGPSIGLEMSASYPPGVQLTAVLMYTLAGSCNDFYYRILSPLFSLATLLATYKFGMTLTRSRVFSLFAVSALCTVPFFWELSIVETYLMASTFMVTLSAFFFFKAYHSSPSDSQKYELIGTLLCGFAALTSYIGLLSLGIIVLYAIQKRLTLKRTSLLVALCSIVVLPWYVRNFLLLGSPIYPFFGIGKFLDPLLRGSTMSHFQNYTLIPLHQLATSLSQVIACISIVFIFYLTFSKRKNFFQAATMYLLLICVSVMAFHVAFPRYLIVAAPILAVLFSTIFTFKPKAQRLSWVTAVALLALIILSSMLMLPFAVKPQSQPGDTKWSYLSRVFEEGEAWKWINENTPKDARIATFDIKDYYIERNVMPLDGNESAPLYKMQTIEESIEFLQDRGVQYLLSVPWASPNPTDYRIPPAYESCPLTKYLGDIRYLPPILRESPNGTMIYHVGPLDEETVYRAFAEKNMFPPLRHLSFNVSITDTAQSNMGKFHMPIPVDYRGGMMVASVSSCKPINVTLWNEIKTTESKRTAEYLSKEPYFVKEWTGLCNNTAGLEESGFIWRIEKAGHFTFFVTPLEKTGAYNVTVDLRFYTNLVAA